MEEKDNMYEDAVKLPFGNVFIGCGYTCSYCKPSFKAQMKRRMPHFDDQGKQINGCQKCYDYEPHWHEDRYQKYLTTKKRMPTTTGDQFIWLSRFGDLAFATKEMIEKLVVLAEKWNDRKFLFQTKNVATFYKIDRLFPPNCMLAITLETNRAYGTISNAPTPKLRWAEFLTYIKEKEPDNPIMVTVEPILEFDLEEFVPMLMELKPERVYVGYNSHRDRCVLPEPMIYKTGELIEALKKFTKVKLKHIPEAL